MGDRVLCEVPPGIAWTAYTDSALLQTVQQITSELQRRTEARAIASTPVIVSTSVASVPGGVGYVACQNAEAMAKPVQGRR